jgi:hypothetical protein
VNLPERRARPAPKRRCARYGKTEGEKQVTEDNSNKAGPFDLKLTFTNGDVFEASMDLVGGNHI